jgi:hypothetical protein
MRFAVSTKIADFCCSVRPRDCACDNLERVPHNPVRHTDLVDREVALEAATLRVGCTRCVCVCVCVCVYVCVYVCVCACVRGVGGRRGLELMRKGKQCDVHATQTTHIRSKTVNDVTKDWQCQFCQLFRSNWHSSFLQKNLQVMEIVHARAWCHQHAMG